MSGSVSRFTSLRPLVAPLLGATILHVCTFFPEQIESIYGGYVYPLWAACIGNLTGLFAFSIGDVVYICFILWLLRWIYRSKLRTGTLVSLLSSLCWIYVFFQLGWGLNYNRAPLDQRLGFVFDPSDSVHLSAMTAQLLTKTNRYATSRHTDRSPAFDSMVNSALNGYTIISRTKAIPEPKSRSVKRSLFGSIGNYLGYSGYFNPFTGEAQLNDAVPSVLHPFVIAHEIGHQLGFAREQDANLTGFLAARASIDSNLRYAAYFDMFLYANGALFATDSMAARKHLNELHPNAKQDLETLRAFRKQYRTPVEDVIDYVYNYYLKANGQTDGTRSYGMVVRSLLAMFRKDGEI